MPRPRAILLLLVVLLPACGQMTARVEETSQPTFPPTTQPRSTTAPATAVPPTSTVSQPTQTPAPATPSASATVPAPSATAPADAITQDSLGDPYYPQLGNGGYDVAHYNIDLAVDVERNVVSGTTTIAARAIQDLPAFNLDWEGPEPSGVTVDGVPARTSIRNGELTIAPPAALPASTIFTTTVAYRGTPDLVGPPDVFTGGWTHYEDGIYVTSEPFGASGWFPANDHPRDKATYTFRITVPEPWIVAANGLLRDTIDQGTTTTFVWETMRPMASYLATVNIGDFVIMEETGPGGLPVRNYFPRSIAQSAAPVFAPTVEMIGYFERLFGPYPFEAYGVVVPDQELGFALETQTLSVFGRDIATARPERVEGIVAHELAHQWFGNSVSVYNWEDIWLSEGFATLGEWLWLEHRGGKEAADEAIRATYAYFLRRSTPPPGRPPATDLFNQGVYGRGGLTLAALRLEVGDERFFQILRTYGERFRYGNASTADFVAVAEEVGGAELDTFFQGWLYETELPSIPALGLAPPE